MQAFTDYPFPFLGDTDGEPAPMRQCTVLGYDGDKYCNIVVGGQLQQVKAGYIYYKAGRCGEVKSLFIKDLEKLPKN